jgi:circadian clock protein KaiC
MAKCKTAPDASERLSTGVNGLDEIMHGGYLPNHAYMLRGGPGSGKTILGLQFLTRAVANGKKGLLITMSEPQDEICLHASFIGLDLKNIKILDLTPTEQVFEQAESYEIFAPSEVEQEPTTRKIREAVDKVKPDVVFIDGLTQLRFLSSDNYQFRKQVIAFLRYLRQRKATVIFTSESSTIEPDDDLQFLSDGVIDLKRKERERCIEIMKSRGSEYLGGESSMNITHEGIKVYPRLVPSEYKATYETETISSGIPELDRLLGGGISRGTVNIISGPSGVGKTSLGLQFMKEAAGRGERSVVYSFEEDVSAIMRRSEGINIPIRKMMQIGTLAVNYIEPLRYSPDEFAYIVRKDVEENGASIVMIDSTSGYQLSVRGASITTHLHAIGRYLKNMGVTVILISEIESVTSNEFRVTEAGVSYLADNIIFLRYIEVYGELRKAIGVLKKRFGDFEKTLREFGVSRYGIEVGKPLSNLRGILSGTPEFVGESGTERL